MLVNPPIRLGRAPYVPPFGVGVIANVLRDAGHDVAMVDMNTARTPTGAEFRYHGRPPDLIGVSGLISTFRVVRDLVPFLRSKYPGVPIVVGGGGITSAPEVYMRAIAPDIGAIGEGEYTALELAEHFEAGHPKLGDISGIVYPDNGALAHTPRRPLEKNLDAFPLPAFDLLDMEAYVTGRRRLGGARQATTLVTRGCPFSCGFCYHIFGRSERYRSVPHVMAEIELLVDNYGVDSIMWADELWTAKKTFVIELCDALVAKRLNLKWSCYSRVDTIDGEMVDAMRRAGCVMIGFGIESGSQRILDAMGKGVTTQQAKDAWELVKRHGVEPRATFIFGYPGEDEESVRETIGFCKDIGYSGGGFFLAPYPGTRVYEEHKDRIVKKFGDLETYFSRLGDASEFVVNLTGWPDEWLVARTNAAKLEIFAHAIMQDAKSHAQ